VNVRPDDPFDKRFRGGSMSVSRPTAATYGAAAYVETVLLDENDGIVFDETGGQIFIDPATTLVGTSGTACVYRDRLAKVSATNTNAILMSRQGNYDEWDYGGDTEDAGRAVILQLSEAGEIGGAVKALVPHEDAFLLAATESTLWVFQGDPAAGGTRHNVSRDVGIISNTAWAKAGDSIVFLAKDGIYVVQANGGGLTNLSLDRIPKELQEVDSAVLGYSHDDNAVYIFATTDAVASSWMFDLDAKGFWPINDTAATTSHLLIGPVRMGQPGEFGQLVNLHGALGEDSGSVTWQIVTGDTAEEAVENAKADIAAGATTHVAASGTLAAGRSHMSYPRVRAMWMVVWLQSTAQWAYEGITLEISSFGRWR